MMLLDILMQNKCPYCKCLLRSGMNECDSCRAAFPAEPVSRRNLCGDSCIAPFHYEGRAADALKAFKFRGIVFNSRSLSSAMANALKEAGDEYRSADMIVSVPMTKARLKKRGFDQSGLLAQGISKQTGIPYEKILIRTVETEYQHNLSMEERKKHSKDYYRVTDKEMVRGKRILLVDDIMTTGATLSSCSQALREAGARDIICAVAAITTGTA